MRNVHRALRKGGPLVVIDPLRTKLAEQANLHLATTLNTDVVLGFVLAAELERVGVHNARFIGENVLAYEEFMDAARSWTIERAAEATGLGARLTCPDLLPGPTSCTRHHGHRSPPRARRHRSAAQGAIQLQS